MKLSFILAFLAAAILVSCNSKPSLQRYFVDNSENTDFISLDVSPTILNLDKNKLTSEQKTALESFDKMNILAFKLDKNNMAKYEEEQKKLAQILKNETYQELIKVGSGTDAASISYVGNEDNIDEFILYANKKETGFAVVRVLGDNMNPNNILTMLSVLKDANIDMEQLKPLEGLMK